jgi:phosphoribosylanthranilate isomerase
VTRVKICGCMKEADAIAAAEAGADFIGIMFANSSRRRVSREEASQIVRAVGTPLREMEQAEPPPMHPGRFDTIEAWFEHGAAALERLLARKRPLVVGVFEDQDPEEVNEIADETGIDLVQLSGDEPWSDCMLVNRPAIKVLRPRPGVPLDEILEYIEANAAIAFMLDPSRGTGTTGDRTAASAVATRVQLWLAGGLTPQNVGAAIRDVDPWLVDVSSGVETDGSKDSAKIAAFVRAVREEDRRGGESHREVSR